MINSKFLFWQSIRASEILRNIFLLLRIWSSSTPLSFLLSLSLFRSHTKHIQDGRLFIKTLELALVEKGNSNSDSGTCTLNHER